MSLHITDDCINCGACDDICPTGAIFEHVDKSIRAIDPERCTECVGFYDRAMCQIECPVECCIVDPVRRETTQQLEIKAKNLFVADELPLAQQPGCNNGKPGGGDRQDRRSV